MGERAAKPSEVLARQIKVWRDRRKLSAQDLANRMAEYGGKLNGIAIRRIENGQRDVSLDEALALAHALAVPPPLLFADLPSGEHVAVLPDIPLHPWLVYQWAAGQEPPLVVSERGGANITRVEEFGQALTAVQLYREEEKAANAVHDAVSNLRNAEYVGESRAVEVARFNYLGTLRDLASVLDQMIENGIQPPGKPAAWIERIRESGLSKYPDRLSIWLPPEGSDGER